MASKSNNLVYEMIDEVESDNNVKNAMKKIFQNEIARSNSSSATKLKVNYCREIIEKAIK